MIALSREQKSAQFLEAAGKKPYDGRKLDESVLSNFIEESAELVEAYTLYSNDPSQENRANLCKEWADVQVTLSNIAWYLDIPAEACLNRVVENNNSKIVDGKVRFRKDGKVLKPDGYVKADMRGL